MLEDPRTYLLELLVALDIEVHRAVYEYLWFLSLDQTSKILSNRRALSTVNPGRTVEHP